MQKNNVRLAGNIGEVKYVEAVDGKKSRIEIAVAQNIDIMDSEEQKTNWHSVVAFGENADVINHIYTAKKMIPPVDLISMCMTTFYSLSIAKRDKKYFIIERSSTFGQIYEKCDSFNGVPILEKDGYKSVIDANHALLVVILEKLKEKNPCQFRFIKQDEVFSFNTREINNRTSFFVELFKINNIEFINDYYNRSHEVIHKITKNKFIKDDYDFINPPSLDFITTTKKAYYSLSIVKRKGKYFIIKRSKSLGNCFDTSKVFNGTIKSENGYTCLKNAIFEINKIIKDKEKKGKARTYQKLKEGEFFVCKTKELNNETRFYIDLHRSDLVNSASSSKAA